MIPQRRKQRCNDSLNGVTVSTKTSVLLEAFDSAIAAKLAPFFAQFRAQHLIGESCYDRWPAASSLNPRPYVDLDGRFFWWINRFVIGDVTVDIGYGDRDFIIETEFFYAGVPDHYAPWELLAAAGVADPHVVSGKAWVLTPAFISEVIEKLTAGLRAHWSILGAPTAAIIDRAQVLRGGRMVFAQNEQRRKDRERSSIQAAAAFHAGRYAEAVNLLEAFRGDAELSPSAGKILKLAEQRSKGA